VQPKKEEKERRSPQNCIAAFQQPAAAATQFSHQYLPARALPVPTSTPRNRGLPPPPPAPLPLGLMGLLAAMCAIDASRSGTLVLLNCLFLCGARIYYAAKRSVGSASALLGELSFFLN